MYVYWFFKFLSHSIFQRNFRYLFSEIKFIFTRSQFLHAPDSICPNHFPFRRLNSNIIFFFTALYLYAVHYSFYPGLESWEIQISGLTRFTFPNRGMVENNIFSTHNSTFGCSGVFSPAGEECSWSYGVHGVCLRYHFISSQRNKSPEGKFQNVNRSTSNFPHFKPTLTVE